MKLFSLIYFFLILLCFLLCLELEDLPRAGPKGAFSNGQFSLFSSPPAPVVADSEGQVSPELSVQLSNGFQLEIALSDEADDISFI